jgi:hypothetical protein
LARASVSWALRFSTYKVVTVYRKSSKGTAEIETRAHKLPPRLRSALILVDGKRSDVDLQALIGPAAADTLATLARDGFVEVISVADTKRAAPPSPVATAAAAPTGPATAPPSTTSASDLTLRRREAVRAINELLGPMGETLSIRIERARSLDELRTLLEQALPVIAGARGRDAAQALAERFSDL